MPISWASNRDRGRISSVGGPEGTRAVEFRYDFRVSALSITPQLIVGVDRLQSRTASFARALWLYSYDRQITIDRLVRKITIDTKLAWFSRRRTSVSFDRVRRIVLRAQKLPGMGLLSVPPFSLLPGADSAFFVISLALDNSADELALFTIWQEQDGDGGWLDSLVSSETDSASLGDESAERVVALLREYLGVPVASH